MVNERMVPGRRTVPLAFSLATAIQCPKFGHPAGYDWGTTPGPLSGGSIDLKGDAEDLI